MGMDVVVDQVGVTCHVRKSDGERWGRDPDQEEGQRRMLRRGLWRQGQAVRTCRRGWTAGHPEESGESSLRFL